MIMVLLQDAGSHGTIPKLSVAHAFDSVVLGVTHVLWQSVGVQRRLNNDSTVSLQLWCIATVMCCNWPALTPLCLSLIGGLQAGQQHGEGGDQGLPGQPPHLSGRGGPGHRSALTDTHTHLYLSVSHTLTNTHTSASVCLSVKGRDSCHG